MTRYASSSFVLSGCTFRLLSYITYSRCIVAIKYIARNGTNRARRCRSWARLAVSSPITYANFINIWTAFRATGGRNWTVRVEIVGPYTCESEDRSGDFSSAPSCFCPPCYFIRVILVIRLTCFARFLGAVFVDVLLIWYTIIIFQQS